MLAHRACTQESITDMALHKMSEAFQCKAKAQAVCRTDINQPHPALSTYLASECWTRVKLRVLIKGRSLERRENSRQAQHIMKTHSARSIVVIDALHLFEM